MNTSLLKQFAQNARRKLIDLVSTKLSIVLDTNSAARRENEKTVKDLEKEISQTSEDQVIEKVAYIWFNRFCALRFMDANRYTTIGVVSPAEGFFQPEILMEAKQGHIDTGLRIDKDKVYGLLNETIPSPEPQQEAYRMLLVAICNDYNSIMPFLFQKIADYTELLMPDDMLSDSSILTATREALSEETCTDVEVIGWLYQFYISEKKDEVFAGLKKNKKVTPENIPAATQLFTPNWIVRYLVENSLGRLWMLNNPGSKLIDRMEYYIKPEQEETDFLIINSPEEIKICDPACGSGHMLVYAFDILYTIYEEEGYDAPKIPQLILENNLYGIEIDERAGELAAFALCMKARGKYRRFFKKNVQPNICVLENVSFEAHEVKSYLDAVNPDLFTMELSTLLYQFKEVDNFGSLIRPELTNIPDILRFLDEKKVSNDMFLQDIHKRVLKVLTQAEYLSPKYHVIVANPPYMGGKGMNGRLGKWARENYPESKSDFFSMFVERIMEMILEGGFSGVMTPFNWMFLGSYEKFRKNIISKFTITNLVRPELHAFFDSAYVSICAFCLFSKPDNNFKGGFIDLNSFYGAKIQPDKTIEAISNPDCGWFYTASNDDFKSIPGNLIAYWLSNGLKDIFKKSENLSVQHYPKKGLTTGNNDEFIRLWTEVPYDKFSVVNGLKWFPMTKGGNFRKWFGNNEYVIDWENDGKRLKDFKGSVIRNKQYYFQEGGSWNDVTVGSFSMRYTPAGFINNAVGPILYSKKIKTLLALLNSCISKKIFEILSPTMKFEIGAVAVFPIIKSINALNPEVEKLITISKQDWDSNEFSWNFKSNPIIQSTANFEKIEDAYDALRGYWEKITKEVQSIEENNNRIFIEAYGVKNELEPDIDLSEVTLTCNPHYRYGNKKTDAVLEKLILADSIKDFISYSVGCMFGRYSLDKPGLILANQGQTIENYLAKIPEPTFKPDDDNVIPIMDVDWFSDDIAERFKRFLKVTFGEEYYTENLEFIETAIGKDIRKFFLKDFYTYHIKMYKKRPIYWMFSSPKGNFNTLIYMHRYKSDTVSIILNDYLREFRTKLTARKDNLENISISTSASQSEKTKALKEIEKIKKVLDEVDGYERDILYPLATKQIEIDLDDGVKVNYPKFGKALKKVAGLS